MAEILIQDVVSSFTLVKVMSLITRSDNFVMLFRHKRLTGFQSAKLPDVRCVVRLRKNAYRPDAHYTEVVVKAADNCKISGMAEMAFKKKALGLLGELYQLSFDSEGIGCHG